MPPDSLRVHAVPLPYADRYPGMQVQVLSAGPVYPHVELSPQPPLLTSQLLIGMHALLLFSRYPGKHEQVNAGLASRAPVHSEYDPQAARQDEAVWEYQAMIDT